MITEIKDIKDVDLFFHDLIAEGVNAHPDDDFTQYINIETGEPTFTAEGAVLRNELMSKALELCESSEIDIYDRMQEVYLKETGLDKYIPLPSQEYNEQE
ncbi:hypothetical protein IDJ77_04145 [Mucilaginibacter sp. ZT4R22]|uniref:Uncharacterized protein n=1 Tax=Mucilaginibacter pankratovii TaxID=2772110 RepID=A0ABR7WKZ7_9SPHI|nr:hypothetical protein [Mucilaginibacter pankratovii]MBD1362993.1 hypothetical protein [Mucilaginibacter pankratovii]